MTLFLERKYTEQHEWVKMDGNVGTVGISQHAQVSQLVADTKYCRSLAFEIDWSIQLNAMKADRVYLPPANEVWGKAMFYTCRVSFPLEVEFEFTT